MAGGAGPDSRSQRPDDLQGRSAPNLYERLLVFQHVAEVLGFQMPLSLHRGIAAAQMVTAHRPGLAAVLHFSSQFACICEQDVVIDLQPSCANAPCPPTSPRTSTESRIVFIASPRGTSLANQANPNMARC